MITIRKYQSNEVRALVEPDSGNGQTKEINAQNAVELTFSLPLYIDFRVGDHATIFSETYTVTVRPTRAKLYKRDYGYTLTMEGEQHKLGRTPYMQLDFGNELTESNFFVNAKPRVFLELILRNLQQQFPGDNWKIGQVLDAEEKNIPFTDQNCLEAINTLAEQFGTEWHIDGDTHTINLIKRQIGTGLNLATGEGQALLSITESALDNSNHVTRLYARGGSQNIGSQYRGGYKNIRMDVPYVEKYIDQFGVWAKAVTYDDIFPKRTGAVTSVTSPFIFTDDAMDFNVNTQLMPGVSAKITFQTGQLAGYTFEIAEDGYDPATKTFTILKNTDEQTLDIPSETLHAEIGDKYILTDIIMPQSYVTEAEKAVKQKAVADLNAGLAGVKYDVACNPFFFKNNGDKVKLGAIVNIDVPEMEISGQQRIVSFTRNIRQPEVFTMQLADERKESTIIRIINTITTAQYGR